MVRGGHPVRDPHLGCGRGTNLPCAQRRRPGTYRAGAAHTVDDLVAFLDEGGYARYAARTAARLQALSGVIDERYDGQVAVIGRGFRTYPELRRALDVLPGWGPVTIQLFLRELRGVWPGGEPPLDQRATFGADTLVSPARLPQVCPPRPAGLRMLPGRRDLESGLVRLALADHRRGGVYARAGTCGVLFT